VLKKAAPRLVSLDIGHCRQLDPFALLYIGIDGRCPLHTLRASGLCMMSDDVLAHLGAHLPDLVDLDLSCSPWISDDGIAAFVHCDEDLAAEKIEITAGHLGRRSTEGGIFFRRITRLRALWLSGCSGLTDRSCEHLAYAVPQLELFSMSNIGSGLRDDGLVTLFKTTPLIRKVDLEFAFELSDRTVNALTPPDPTFVGKGIHPGSRLEHVVFSHVFNLSDAAVSLLIRNCTRLVVLEIDNTHLTDAVAREFIRTVRMRKIRGAELGAVDCRSIGRQVVNELAGQTRTRRGSRSWPSSQFSYHEAGRGLCEYDDSKVVLHSYWSWVRVDEADRELRARGKKRNKLSGKSRLLLREGGATVELSSDGGRGWLNSTRRVSECTIS
jgi:F-box/leucine-rich repeat protein 2/20